MITGDSRTIARETARALRLGDSIVAASDVTWPEDVTAASPDELAAVGKVAIAADGFAQVFPEHKYLLVESLRKSGFAVGMTGDGVNDAPALKRADVGIAVSGATDAARAAADIVLTEPGLSTVVHALFVARQIFQVRPEKEKKRKLLFFFLNIFLSFLLSFSQLFPLSLLLFNPLSFFNSRG